MALGAFVLLIYLGHRIGFYFDEWNFALDRRGHALHVFLDPHNEHIALVPVLVYKVLFAIVGFDHHWLYLVVLLVMHLLLGLGVYLLAGPRVGAWPSVLVATLILFAGLAWQNMLWPFQIGFVGSVLGGVWAWVALDRDGRRADPLACAALVFSIVSSSLGVPMALGVAAELAVASRLRAVWIAAVPLALYVLWYIGYGASTITSEGVLHAAPWAVSAVAAAAGALFGLGSSWGATLAVLAVLALGWRLALLPPTPRLLGLLVAGVAFWALTGAARSAFQPPVPPESSRYLTFGVVVIALAAVELAQGVAFAPRLLPLGAMIVVVAVALGLPVLGDNARQLRAVTGRTEAALGAMQLIERSAPPAYQPDPQDAPQISASRYFAATRSFGPAGDSPAQLASDLSGERAQADLVLQQLVARLTPAGTPASDCDTLRAAGAQPAVTSLMVTTGGVVVRALGRQGVAVKLRRFADAFVNAPVGTVAPGAPRLLRLPADASPRPYQVQLVGPTGLEVCRA